MAVQPAKVYAWYKYYVCSFKKLFFYSTIYIWLQ